MTGKIEFDGEYETREGTKKMEKKEYDLIIVGSGPGALSCAMYATRAGFSVLTLDRGMPGGQMAMTEWVDNYPGFPEGISGQELTERMLKHAQRFGAEQAYGNVAKIEDRGEDCFFNVHTDSGEVLKSSMVVIATGAQPRSLGLEGEKRLNGRGVSYCAICDGNFFKGKTVAVIGGGDAAVEEATYLSNIVDKVVLVHRRDELRASQVAQDVMTARENIEIAWNSQIENVLGDEKVEGIRIRNTKTDEKKVIDCEGVFFYVGIVPITEFVKDLVELDAQGFIVTNENMETSVCGIYAIGDVRRPMYRQIGTAVSDGIVAALNMDVAMHKKPPRVG